MIDIIDDFLDINCYNSIKQYSQDHQFEDIVNPIDGVTYPDILLLPDDIKKSIINRLEVEYGSVTNSMIFMRMSKRGTPCPHIHHHDGSHGTHSMMLYFEERDDAGTALVRHRATGCTYAPEDDDIVHWIQHDCNDLSKWIAYDGASMKPNRAAIFDARLLHRAEPVGGYGYDQIDGRIVLTCFFTVEEY